MSIIKASISTVSSLIFFIFVSSVCADILVQLNVNRPYNDVNEKFVSFTVEPEDLYKALDGPNRKTLTNMATMLGSSYVKFSNDYNFIPDVEIKYRNPTKTIWKGFNRWTSHVNWTMIIPMPYNAGEWDPMESLRILNSSYLTGITDCIWQLGTEFGPSVTEYFNDLKTLNLMVDTYNPYVDDWEITAAEIPASTTNEEIKRFIELSKDMSAAYNWQQPADMSTSNTLIGSAYDLDRPLRAILNEKVPVWLNFVPKDRTKKSNQSKQKTTLASSSGKTSAENINDVLIYLQTLGEAASSGFDAVFRHLNQYDLEHPSHGFYATMLFKKVMGSRVFPARPFTIFLRTNKLYTHCANTVSGGIAFMIVNTEDDSKQISVRSLTKLPGEEYWQYVMTFKRNQAYLNNEKLTINSTLTPQIKTKSPNKAIQLNLPAKSVGFWVLPHAELEHCQFTEIDVDEMERRESHEEEEEEADAEKVIQKRHSSADKLLQQLIQKTALAHSSPTKSNHRGRRYATQSSRARHVVLEDKEEHMQSLSKLFEPLSLEEKTPKKREEVIKDRRTAALKWIRDLLDTAMQEREDLFPLKRNTRSVDDYFGRIFGGPRVGKKATIVKKITEIRKPEKKSVKPAFDPDHFDEEEFFKKMGTQNEPEPPRVPEGDVHLKHISNVEGEEVLDSDEQEKKKRMAQKVHGTIGKEARNEMKPLRLLPTEFYEALPLPTLDKIKINNPSTWNTLLFPEPFTKKSKGSTGAKGATGSTESTRLTGSSRLTASNSNDKKMHNNSLDDAPQMDETYHDIEKVETTQFQNSGQLAEDFLLAQEELARSFLREHEHEVNEEKEQNNKFMKKELSGATHSELEDETTEKSRSMRSKYIDYLADNLERYLNERGIENDLDDEKSAENIAAASTTESSSSWWDLSSLRKRRSPRALRYPLADEDSYLSNLITKDEELMPLGSVAPEQLVENEIQLSNRMNKDEETSNVKTSGYLRTMKDKVDRFVGIVTRHVNDWYNTFALPVDEVVTMDMKENKLKTAKSKRRS